MGILCLLASFSACLGFACMRICILLLAEQCWQVSCQLILGHCSCSRASHEYVLQYDDTDCVRAQRCACAVATVACLVGDMAMLRQMLLVYVTVRHGW
jgi:hypothetical protein